MEKLNVSCVKRTQKDYSLSFKLSVVKEIESGELSISGSLRKYGIQSHSTVLNWCRKYGTFDRELFVNGMHKKTPEQRIYELEQENQRLTRCNTYLESRLTESEDKAAILDKVIELAEKEYLLPIRKNSSPDQSKSSTKRAKKA